MEHPSKAAVSPGDIVSDLVDLTKARLSVLVVLTALFGYFVATRTEGAFSPVELLHLGLGTLLAACGAAVFNQIMESDADARMPRTAERPLPSHRIPAPGAFVLGWLLSGFGVVHLAMTLNFSAGAFAAITLFVYLFIYTPMKRRSSFNTIVGAISGAFPPLIGWAAGDGALWSAGAIFLFALLFLWQMPHFAAINWIYREDYRKGGFVMWSNDDESGSTTATIALVVSLGLVLLGVAAGLGGVLNAMGSIAVSVLGAVMCLLSWKFLRSSRREDARGLFFYSLLYLPAVMVFGYLGWK